MIDFSLFCTARWKGGNVPLDIGATHMVSQGNDHYAYCVPQDGLIEFAEWVALRFAGDSDPIFGPCDEMGEYLDLIGVSIGAVHCD